MSSGCAVAAAPFERGIDLLQESAHGISSGRLQLEFQVLMRCKQSLELAIYVPFPWRDAHHYKRTNYVATSP